jgi:hypothetical protein
MAERVEAARPLPPPRRARGVAEDHVLSAHRIGETRDEEPDNFVAAVGSNAGHWTWVESRNTGAGPVAALSIAFGSFEADSEAAVSVTSQSVWMIGSTSRKDKNRPDVLIFRPRDKSDLFRSEG